MYLLTNIRIPPHQSIAGTWVNVRGDNYPLMGNCATGPMWGVFLADCRSEDVAEGLLKLMVVTEEADPGTIFDQFGGAQKVALEIAQFIWALERSDDRMRSAPIVSCISLPSDKLIVVAAIWVRGSRCWQLIADTFPEEVPFVFDEGTLYLIAV